MPDLTRLVNDLSALTVIEAAELAKMLEEKWGVSAAAPVAVAAAGRGARVLARPVFRVFCTDPARRVAGTVLPAASGGVTATKDLDRAPGGKCAVRCEGYKWRFPSTARSESAKLSGASRKSLRCPT